MALGRTKTAVASLAALALVGAAGAWWFKGSKAPEPKYETVAVDKGRIVAKVTASGTVSALVTVQVGSQVSGRVQTLLADFNSTVKQGDLIAKIDPQMFQAALEQAEANAMAAQGGLTRARAQALEARRQHARAKELLAKQLVAQADVDTAQANDEAMAAQVAVAEGSVQQARASLRQAKINLQYTDIRSPISGTVISRNVDVGQTVAASLAAPTLFVIAEDLRKMQVDTHVAEADIGKLSAGMATSFTVDAYPGERFRGTVRQIRNAPQTVQSVVTYDAVIDVDNALLRLRPGMTANVTFIFAEKDDSLRIPNAALRFKPSAELVKARAPSDGGTGETRGAWKEGRREVGGEGRSDKRTVWVLREGKPTPVHVRTGISDGTLTELVEGDLREGDSLITEVQVPGGSGAKPPGAPMGGPGGMRRVF